METLIKGIATFLTTAVLGVVHFFYKPPVMPVVQTGNEPISVTSTLPSSFSATSSPDVPSTGIATTSEGAVPMPNVPTSPSMSGASVPSVSTPSPASSARTPSIEMPVPIPSHVSYGAGVPAPSMSTKSASGAGQKTVPLVTDMTPPMPSIPFVPYPTSVAPVGSNLTAPIAAIGNYLLNNMGAPIATSTSATTPSSINIPPPLSVSSGLTQSNSGTSTAGSPTIIDQQIAALAGLPLSTPQKQEPLNTTGPEMYKVFDFAVSANSFTPNAIIVQQGDLAQLNITSSINTALESKDLQFSVPITVGGTSAVSIPATNIGTFVFYATGSNSQTIFGYFVVRAR